MKGWLLPIEGPIPRPDMLVCDIETKDGESQNAGFTRPFLTGFYDGERVKQYRGPQCIDALLNAILVPEHSGKLIWAHNAGRFDYLFFLPMLAISKFTIEIIPVQSGIQLLKVSLGHKYSWRFLDSMKLLPMSLDKAAKTLGVEGKLSHDLNMHEDDERWLDYHAQDLFTLWEVMQRFSAVIVDTLHAELRVSLASTSMNYFRRNHMSHPIPRERHTHEFVREAYYGGRTEVYRKKGTNLNCYDINSSYPFAMTKPLPCGKAFEYYGKPPDSIRQMGGFVRARLEIPDNIDYPPLPVRHDGKLFFPTGKIEGVWAWPELQLAEQWITEYQQSYWFETSPFLSTFVQALYAYRDKSRPDYNEGMAAIAKLLMNSLFGKFGMRTLRRQLLIQGMHEIPEGAIPASGEPESLVWYTEEEKDASYVLPQVSAYITSLARVELYKWMKYAAPVYYVDTDSIITEKKLDTDTALGGLKLEAECFDGMFLSPKLYALYKSDWENSPYPTELLRKPLKVAAKGFGRNHRTLESLGLLSAGEELAYEELEKLGGMARRNFESGPRMLSKTKGLRNNSEKRHYAEDGTSKPVRLEMW